MKIKFIIPLRSLSIIPVCRSSISNQQCYSHMGGSHPSEQVLKQTKQIEFIHTQFYCTVTQMHQNPNQSLSLDLWKTVIWGLWFMFFFKKK